MQVLCVTEWDNPYNMRVLCCGDRSWNDTDTVLETLWEYKDIPNITIVHGCATGADYISGVVARELGYTVEEHPAKWDLHGRAAGPMRNRQMLDSGIDHVIAFHDDISSSKGTKHMISITEKADVSFEIKKSKWVKK